MLNIVARDEDDDGKVAGEAPKISFDTVEALRKALGNDENAIKRFCLYFNIARIEDLNEANRERAERAIAQSNSKKGD
jgi:hypothetical protein